MCPGGTALQAGETVCAENPAVEDWRSRACFLTENKPNHPACMTRRRTCAPKTNRVSDYLQRIEEYWFHGPQARFARDAGISETMLSRILRGKTTNPRYSDILKIVRVLERKLGKRIDPRDVYEP